MPKKHHSLSNPYKTAFYALLVCIQIAGAIIVANKFFSRSDIPPDTATTIVIPTLIPEQPWRMGGNAK